MNKYITGVLFVYAISIAHAQQFSSADSLPTDTGDTQFQLPVFSTTGADAEADMDQQDVSSLLQSSKDVFTQFSSFQFSNARYRLRGYAAENQMIMINGINVNSLETGFATWSNWGGLNDVTRYTETRFGLGANRYGFSGPGGYTNINSRASDFKKGSRASYGVSNRIFRNRFMLTHSTGMMKNGWAITLSASARNGEAVYIPGTYFNAQAFYLSIDKRINEKHLLSFTGFYAPIEQGRSNGETIEAYTIAKDNYYNSAWGLQNGKVRNASVSRVNKPQLQLHHVWSPNATMQWDNGVFYSFGTMGLSGLNWNDAPNPRPDYYRYLPSYYRDLGNNSMADYSIQQWNTQLNTRQIDWDRMIRMNQSNLYSLPGSGVVNTTETRARYILENRIDDHQQLGYNSIFNKRFGSWFLSSGLQAYYQKTKRYKILEDLLGSTFWLDYDQFAPEQGVSADVQQNNLDNPDRKILQGDTFGYNYALITQRQELWSQLEWNGKNMDAYTALSISRQTTQREGYWANGKFPTTSKGSSNLLELINYGAKAGITYKISGKQFLTANTLWQTRSPEAQNIFLSPRSRQDMVSEIKPEIVISNDISYRVQAPGFKFRFTLYHSQFNQQLWLRSFWSDEFNNNINLFMNGLNQTHQGIEMGIEKVIYTAHTLQGALGWGQFYYTNRPVLQAWQDNNANALFTNRTVYLKHYRVGGTPQFVAGIGYKYNAPAHWFYSIYANYFDAIYVEPNPDRRTAEAVSKYLDSEVQYYAEIIDQFKLPSYYVFNAQLGKSFKIWTKYFLNVNISINNLFNDRQIISGGFESLRWDKANISKFDNKYFYMTGTTYMCTVNFNF
ncbi:MAG: hypothetical protein ACO28K_08985 [Bacteroidia bacterium]